MNNSALAVIAALMIPAAASAQALPEGSYQGRGDGTTLGMTVVKDRAVFVVANPGTCVGGAQGDVSQAGSGRWTVDITDGAPAVVSITEGSGAYSIRCEGECSHYSGFGCFIEGEVRPVAAAATGSGADAGGAASDFSFQNAKLTTGQCYGQIDGQVLIDHECDIGLGPGGDFLIAQRNGRVFIEVLVTGKGQGTARYREVEGSDTLTLEDLGPVTRETSRSECWSSSRVRACAK